MGGCSSSITKDTLTAKSLKANGHSGTGIEATGCSPASITYDEVIEAGEHLPGMAALWEVASIEERYEMVTIILEPGGLYYDLENKMIAAIKPRPAFLPVLRMLNGVMELMRPGVCL